MRLPNGERAIVDIAKLRTYSLNPNHPRGRNKARVFAAALGLRLASAGALRTWLLEVAATSDQVTEAEATTFGRLFEISADMCYRGRRARLRTAWMIRNEEDFPRLVTVFVE